MKLTPKQAQMLYQIAVDSLRTKDISGAFALNHEARAKLVDDILNQQDDKKPHPRDTPIVGGYL